MPAIASGHGVCDLSLEDWAVVGVPEGTTASFAGGASDEACTDSDAEAGIGRVWLRERRAGRFADRSGHERNTPEF